MTDELKLTFEEFMALFGGEIPVEAMDLVMHSPPGTLISDIRKELTAMADRKRAKDAPAVTSSAAEASVAVPPDPRAIMAALGVSCATCAHWEKPRPDEWDVVESIMGRCRRTPHSVGMTEWSKDENDTRRVLSAEYADRTAAAYDGSGYHAGLLTRADHFCAMWERRA